MNNDLISRAALIDALYETEFKMYVPLVEIDIVINNMPAVDAEPVRTGTWLFVGYGKPDAWDCSECDAMVSKRTRYCPNCGAKMDVEETT